MGSLTEHLRELVDETARTLPGVTWKRMFGCDAAFTGGHIFALIWHDRIGVKLPDPQLFGELMAVKGASPWSPSNRAKGFSSWVLVPESFHDDQQALEPWVRSAHALVSEARAAEPKKKKTPPARKRATAKRRATVRR